MTIAITGATGHIGSVIAERLLEEGADITLLVRDPQKAIQLAARGAELAVGSIENLEFVLEATRGVEALFWLTPPNFGASDFRAYQNRLADIAAAAIKENRIPYVVNLSSFGAELGQGAGPVNGLRDVEEKLNAVATNIIHLRPGFFMENFINSLGSIKQAGGLFAPIQPTTDLPLIATHDIGIIAAELLLKRDWSGRNIRELHGPKHTNHQEVVSVLSRTLGTPVSFTPVTAEQAIQGMTGAGVPKHMAELYAEMYRGIDSGLVRPLQPLGPETKTSTTFEQFAATILKPAFEQG